MEWNASLEVVLQTQSRLVDPGFINALAAISDCVDRRKGE